MINQNVEAPSNFVAFINQAFDNGNFYGLEYVLDELVSENPATTHQNTVDWFGATDYFA
ncbi:hypothetical protein [Methylobacter sp. S3L5C]|uniref:hypothetical protein n=1 Tax=Methylobacter sp. S3L5C TaxID=2839024 RepID=UPI001FAD9957|nr:hypothetical protein [Methylobacter sp. S3L5C]UOA09568.1 hypothetical protein KKZ03_04555 [Methylobacter sp. S3L5C]